MRMKVAVWLLVCAAPSISFAALPFSESFEGTGYENTWTETIDAGNTVDEDSTAVSPPTCGGSHVLYTDTGGTNAQAFTLWDNGAGNNGDNRIRFYIKFNNVNTGDSATMEVFRLQGTVRNLYINFRYNPAGGLNRHLSFGYYSSGEVTVGTSSPLNEDQWYRVEARYDSTNALYEFLLDGVSLFSGSIATPRTDSRYYRLGHSGARTHNIYFDLAKWTTTGSWIGAETCAASSKGLSLGVYP